MTTTRDDRPLIRIGHSPDPDDAFMWWPLLPGAGGASDGRSSIETGRFRFESIVDDIEMLNRRSETADLEITAMSCAQYPHVQDRYALTACGASMGENYGPKLVARKARTLDDLRAELTGAGGADRVLAVPGRRTSAFGAVSLMLGPGAFRYAEVPFDRIIERVAAGDFTAGVVIHEGQLTFESAGLHLVEDLGAWWWRRHGLPIPLGVNAIRRDLDDELGPGTRREITAILRRSVEHALEHREASVRYALAFARDMGAQLADRFIEMYVNSWTLDFGPVGRRAVGVFLDELHGAGLSPAPDRVEFVAAAT